MPTEPRPRSRGRMKRLLLLLLAYTVGGAIINVAVAWGCALWVTSSESLRPKPLDFQAPFALYERDQPFANDFKPTLMVYSVENPGEQPMHEWAVPALSTYHVRGKHDEKSGRQATMMVVRSGWPWLALRGEYWRTDGTSPSEERYIYAFDCHSLGIQPPKDVISFWEGGRVVPLEPLWPGFAINTIFYAAMIRGLWLLFGAPGFVRRRLRAQRGRCPACAYPVGASDVCTECGAVLPFPQAEGRSEGEARDSKDAQRS